VALSAIAALPTAVLIHQGATAGCGTLTGDWYFSGPICRKWPTDFIARFTGFRDSSTGVARQLWTDAEVSPTELGGEGAPACGGDTAEGGPAAGGEAS
jgi:hypothetical protein